MTLRGLILFMKIIAKFHEQFRNLHAVVEKQHESSLRCLSQIRHCVHVCVREMLIRLWHKKHSSKHDENKHTSYLMKKKENVDPSSEY